MSVVSDITKSEATSITEHKESADDDLVDSKFNWKQKFLLIHVCLGLFLVNMLLTIVVPIIPDILWRQHQNQLMEHSNCSDLMYNMSANAHSNSSSNSNSNSRLLVNAFLTKSPAAMDHNPDVTIKCLKVSNQQQLASDMSTKIGLLFASQAVAQMVFNLIVGPLNDKIGFSIPMIVGFAFMFMSTIAFAFCESYAALFAARTVQGVGTAFVCVTGHALVATVITDDKSRSEALSWSLGSMGFGVLVGPPFGGIVTEFVGKTVAFLIPAALLIVWQGLQLLTDPPAATPQTQAGPSLRQLLLDPLILLAAATLALGSMSLAVLQPTLPVWMRRHMQAATWQQGVAFVPTSVAYVVAARIFGSVGFKVGWWLSAFIGFLLMSVSTFMIPLAGSLAFLILPNLMLGIAIGIVDSAMMPIMAAVVDRRHSAVYGGIYAIANFAFSIDYAIGPAISGVLVDKLGFVWMMRLMTGCNLAITPILLLMSCTQEIRSDQKRSVEDTESCVNIKKDFTEVCQELQKEVDEDSKAADG